MGAVGSAVLNLADRVPPPVLVAGSALLAALATAAIARWAHSTAAAIPLRFLTSVALAGAYPVGMKIVVS